MFKNIIKCLDEFSNIANSESAERGVFNAEEADILEYFDLHLAEAIMKEKYIDAKKVAKFILAQKENDYE